MWKYFTDLFDYLPLTALIENQVRDGRGQPHDPFAQLSLQRARRHAGARAKARGCPDPGRCDATARA